MFVTKQINGVEVFISDTQGISLLPHASQTKSEVEKTLLFKDTEGKAFVFNDVIVYKGSAWGISKKDAMIGSALTGEFGHVFRTKKIAEVLEDCLSNVIYSEAQRTIKSTGLELLVSGDYKAFMNFKIERGVQVKNFFYKADYFEGLQEKINALEFTERDAKSILRDVAFSHERRGSIASIGASLFDGRLDHKPMIREALRSLIYLNSGLKLLFKEKFKSPRVKYEPPSFDLFLSTSENFAALSIYNVGILFDLFTLLITCEHSLLREFTEEKFKTARAEYYEVLELLRGVNA